MSTGYKPIYDVAQESTPVWFPTIGLIFVVLGALLWLFHERMTFGWHGPLRRSPRARRIFTGFFLGFSVLWTTVAAVAVLGSD